MRPREVTSDERQGTRDRAFGPSWYLVLDTSSFARLRANAKSEYLLRKAHAYGANFCGAASRKLHRKNEA